MVYDQQRRKRALSPRALKPKPGRLDFVHERTAWPFVHAVLPLALYAVSRNLALSLLLIYVWESLEAIGSLFTRTLTESKPNALISDPLVGALAIFALYVLDCAFGWGESFCESVPLGLRLGAFAVLALFNGLAFFYTPRVQTSTWTLVWPVPVIALLYAAALLIFFNRAIFRPQSDAEADAGASVLVWLLLASFFAMAATLSPPSDRFFSSTFVRVVLAEVLVLVVALVVRTAQN